MADQAATATGAPAPTGRASQPVSSETFKRGARRDREIGQRRSRYLFLVPATIAFLVFFVGPAIAGIVLSLFSWGPLDSPTYVGLNNYREIFSDPIFWNSVKVTLLVVGTALLTQLPLALGLALLASRQGRIAAILRVILFLPNVLSLVAIALLWKQIFDPTSGIANKFVGFFGLGPYAWLGSPSMALWTLMLVVLWASVGFHVVIQLSGLSTIPKELLDAGRLDTRSDRQVFLHVTLPLLRESIAISSVLVVTQSLAVPTGLFLVMTNGGPIRSTEVLGLRTYFEGVQSLHFGLANAIATVSIVLTMAIVSFFLYLAGRSRLEY